MQMLQKRRLFSSQVLGILKEKHNMWERRAPLSPSQVKELIRQNDTLKVLIQPCSRRIFSNQEYIAAGANINEDLSEASTILGVKSPDPSELMEGKSYMFFGHITKAQPYSMPLLDTLLEKNIRLFDYEAITKDGRDDTQRLVAFGYYAGVAGMIDGFRGLGLRLLSEGFSTPFLNVSFANMYPTVSDARETIAKVGKLLETSGVGLERGIAIAFTGQGNVSQVTNTDTNIKY